MAADIIDLLRRWALDWLNCRDPAVLPEILDENYVLHIGGHDLTGRNVYREATVDQLRQFPGLMLTVHDVITDGTRAAVRFTEHGSSRRHEGRAAAWRGIALFRAGDERLVESYAEEDYLARRRQLLRGGVPDAIDVPHVAPWDVRPTLGDMAREGSVRAWLDSGHLWARGVQLDDQADADATAEELLEVRRTEVNELFSAGERVAFHVTQHGRRCDSDEPAQLHAVGLVGVVDGHVAGGHVIRDRLGLLRARAATSAGKS